MSTCTLARAEVLSELLNERWSCRAFRDRPVPPATLDRLLEMAQRSPSWCNVQPWHATVVTGERLERLRADLMDYAATHAEVPDIAFPEKYEGAYRDRRRECGWQLYDSVGIVRGDADASNAQMMENFRFFGAPAIAVITGEPALGTYGVLDCGVYLGNFMLAAQSLGLASIAQASIASHSSFMREQLQIPASRQVIVGVSFGYADPEHPTAGYRTSRAAISDAVTALD